MMAIVRTIDLFAIVPHAALRDPGLSLQAKGLLGLMLSFSDDCAFNMPDLVKLSANGRAAVRTAFKELEAAGYVVRLESRTAQGRRNGYEYVVHADPAQRPVAIEPNS